MPQQTAAKTTYDPVVFSRKNTYNSPSTAGSSLSSVIHQADSSGKQQSLDKTLEEPKGLSKLFMNLCSSLGLAEQQKLSQQFPPPHVNNLSAAVPPPGPTHQQSQQVFNGHLGPIHEMDLGKKCLVLDLDETLVHSSFKPTKNPDYIIPVEIDGIIHNVYVAKRPGVDEFMKVMSQHYEIVVYTASLSKYANPLLDQLDIHKTIRHRLFREHCVRYEGSYVKDLSTLDRDLSQTIIIDNSAMSYVFHPQNAIGCTSFIDDMADRELISIQKFLTNIVSEKDVRHHLFKWSPDSFTNALVG